MAMYFMNGKTFLNQYIEEDPRIVLKTQFVIVSSTIRKSGKYEKSVINANNILYPSQEMILDFDDYKHNDHYRDLYYQQLEENKAFLATLIKGVIKNQYTIVFLCSYKEKKYDYFNILKEFILEEFNFNIYDYKKYKEGKEKPIYLDEEQTLKLCNKAINKREKDRNKSLLSSEKGREKLFSSMSKKQMVRELKKRDLFIDGMSKSDMIDMLDAFM